MPNNLLKQWETEIEKFMVLGPHLRLDLVKQSLEGLLGSIDEIPSKPSPTYEQYHAFALELATRTLLSSNEERAQELFPIFQAKFRSVALKLSKLKKPVPVPFLVERIVVTILRSSIHLYKIPKVSCLSSACFCFSFHFFLSIVKRPKRQTHDLFL